jgi:hypothetical protein
MTAPAMPAAPPSIGGAAAGFALSLLGLGLGAGAEAFAIVGRNHENENYDEFYESGTYGDEDPGDGQRQFLFAGALNTPAWILGNIGPILGAANGSKLRKAEPVKGSVGMRVVGWLSLGAGLGGSTYLLVTDWTKAARLGPRYAAGLHVASYGILTLSAAMFLGDAIKSRKGYSRGYARAHPGAGRTKTPQLSLGIAPIARRHERGATVALSGRF